MFRKAQTIILAAAVWVWFMASSQAAEVDPGAIRADVLDSGTEPKLIHKVAPEYPASALHRGVEGWVSVSYVVNTDGTTSEIRVLDASIDGYFEEAAMDATSRFRYEPATWNGEPIKSANILNRFTFKIVGAETGVSRRFYAKYQKALKALDGGDLERAGKLIDQLDKMKQRRFSELFHLDKLKGIFWLKKKNYLQSLQYFERSLVPGRFLPDQSAYHAVLQQAISLNAAEQNYAAALQHYDALVSNSELSEDNPIHEVARKVKQQLHGNNPIHHNAKVERKYCRDCQDSDFVWDFTLFRNRFTINHVEGKLSELRVKCSYQYRSLSYSPDTVWTVNREWGDCTLEVFGVEGTMFKLIELPNG